MLLSHTIPHSLPPQQTTTEAGLIVTRFFYVYLLQYTTETILKMAIVYVSETSEYLTTTWYINRKENNSLMNNRCRRLEAYNSSVIVL
jgi:hypothetical protein